MSESGLSASDIGYAAGFVDGEGTIGITWNNGRYFTPYIGAAQVVREPLDKLCDMFGGSVYSPYKSRSNWGAGTCTWRLSGVKAIEAVELLYPHLIVKRREAEFILEYKALGLLPFGHKVHKQLEDARFDLYKRFREYRDGRSGT